MRRVSEKEAMSGEKVKDGLEDLRSQRGEMPAAMRTKQFYSKLNPLITDVALNRVVKNWIKSFTIAPLFNR